MKRFIWVLIWVMLTSLAYGQDSNIRKGPLTKNRKLWRQKVSTSSNVVNFVRPVVRKGVSTKRTYSPRRNSRKFTQSVKKNRTRIRLKGPRAKNYSPVKYRDFKR